MKTIFTFLLLLGVAFGQVSPTGTNYSGLSTPGAITGTTVVGGLGVVSSVSPTYDLVADGGCDPTGTTAADTCFAAAHNYFNSKAGGTITGCGVFKLTAPPWVITNPGLKIRNSCGARGTPDFASAKPIQTLLLRWLSSAVRLPPLRSMLNTHTLMVLEKLQFLQQLDPLRLRRRMCN